MPNSLSRFLENALPPRDGTSTFGPNSRSTGAETNGLETLYSALRPLEPIMSPISALTALPGVSFTLASVSNLESISSLRPVCSNIAMARADTAPNPSYSTVFDLCSTML